MASKLYQPHMVDWMESDTRLEEMVWLPGGGPAFTVNEKGRRVYTRTGEGQYVQFLEYHRLNPDVFTLAAGMARRMYKAHKGIGARQIMERFRWELHYGEDRPEGQEAFRLNNGHIPFYGRLLLLNEVIPYSEEMFSTKRLGEPGWWCDYLSGLFDASEWKPERAGIESRLRSANALRMRGTDEAPPAVLP